MKNILVFKKISTSNVKLDISAAYRLNVNMACHSARAHLECVLSLIQSNKNDHKIQDMGAENVYIYIYIYI